MIDKLVDNIQVVSVNISEKKGTIKKPVKEIILTKNGVEHDAHAGDWHRQVSFLGVESIQKFKKLLSRELFFGEFAENITTSGMLLYKASPLDRFKIGETEIEITQIGKECHGNSCAIFQEIGSCVMPKEGIFGRVIRPGKINAGMLMEYLPRTYKILIITLSDRASRGEYSDRSGPEIEKKTKEYLDGINWRYQIDYQVIPDDGEQLRELLKKAKEENVDIVFTTGGTGIGPRDITPDVVRELLDKEITGIMDMIRLKYGENKPNALLSRSVAGVMGESLVYTLPGSVKAVREYLSEIFKTLQHLIFMLHGIDAH